MAVIKQPLDWLGVNYYTRHIVTDDPDAAWPAIKTLDDPLPKTAMDWAIFPEGLKDFLVRMSRDYMGDTPIYVTENGMAWDDSVDGDAVADPVREQYISDHILAAKDAIAAGANVKGFFYWSLLDNFEWAFGYDKRFGIVHVDYATQKRTPKNSFKALTRALQTNR